MYRQNHPKEYNIKDDEEPLSSKIIIRVTDKMKEDFKKSLKKNDAIQSNVLRRCIEEYINKNN